MAALRGGRPQQNISPVTSSFAPSAGYIGKKTLKRNSETLRLMAEHTKPQNKQSQIPAEWYVRESTAFCPMLLPYNGLSEARKACQALS
mmetsp:Transcript_64557/g.169767  ORF Transcript_64557/g.169767 Transcript_64557/m.169767 type:complete len:89 (-) Transcript_64557:103-369(-)